MLAGALLLDGEELVEARLAVVADQPEGAQHHAGGRRHPQVLDAPAHALAFPVPIVTKDHQEMTAP